MEKQNLDTTETIKSQASQTDPIGGGYTRNIIL